MRSEAEPDHDEKADVQRGSLIEGLVETTESGEELAEHAACDWTLERKAKRKRQKTGNGHELHGEQPLRVTIELTARRSHEHRDRVEKVDLPERNDRPGKERNRAFPAVDNGPDIRTTGSHRVRKSVAREEERTEECEPRDGATPGTLTHSAEV